MRQLSRRTAVKTVVAGGLASRLAPGASGSRVLVGVYLSGGNDSNNMVVPFSGQYPPYASIRGPLAIPRASLPQVTAASTQKVYGFHIALSGLKALFDQRVLAVVANVGSAGSPATQLHRNAPVQYLQGGYMSPRLVKAAGGAAPLTFQGGLSMALLDSAAPKGGIQDNPAMLAAMAKATLLTKFPPTSLGKQLEKVARLIQAGAQSAMGRQVFCCVSGSYDTHSRQLVRQAALFTELNDALTAFYAATVEMGVSQNVTTYTDTEFNRALAPNKKGGSEHGWAGHHLVMGGSVVGGDVHGAYPPMALGGPADATGTGVWVPGITRDQFEATLANWAGVPLANLFATFPSLAASAKPRLGFLL